MFERISEIEITVGAPPPDLPQQDGLIVLLLCRGDVDPDWQWQMACKIAATRPVLAAAWGPGTTTWDNAIDFAVIFGQDEGWLPDNLFVMTTWHDHEPLADTINFLSNFGKYGDVAADKLLVLNAGNTPAALGSVGQILAFESQG